jgi:hypothetical protein
MKALFPEDEAERWRHCGNLRVQRVYDTDLSDDAWTLIEPMLPVPRFGGDHAPRS